MPIQGSGRQGLIAITLALACCARSAPVDVAMVSAHESATRFDFVPQYVDVRHARDGWQRIPLATSASKMELIEYGQRVRLATSNLPKGQYSAVRLGVLVASPTDEQLTPISVEDRQVRRTRTLSGLQLEQHEITLVQPFCVNRRGAANQLVLQVFRAAPANPGEAPALTIAEAPRC